MKPKIIAGLLALGGAIVAVLGLIYEPAYLIGAASPDFPLWVKWLGLLFASAAIAVNLATDITDIRRHKKRLSK